MPMLVISAYMRTVILLNKIRARIICCRSAAYAAPPAERFIRLTTIPGDTVVDPFMGSGTTALAAKKNGRHFIGIELSPEFAAAAIKRINGEQYEQHLCE